MSDLFKVSFPSLLAQHVDNCPFFTESDSTELSKLLDMKGVKKSDQGSFMDLYREQIRTMEVSDPNNPGSLGSDVVASPLQTLHSSPTYSGTDGSRIAKLEKMIKNRL